MKKIKKVVSSLLVLLMMFAFVACNGSKTSKSLNATSIGTKKEATKDTIVEKKYTIGWSVYNSAYEYFISMQDGVFAKAKELGIDVITQDQKGSTVEMINGGIDLIAKGIDALVISPYNPEAMIILVAAAKEAGIPVIVVDIGTGGADVEAFIISDNFAGGILAGEYALHLIKERSLTSKNVAIIKCEKTAPYANRRGEAFKSVLIEKGYKVVAEITANSEQSEAYKSMNAILASFEDLAVVFCENDRMALGAAQAIEEAGKKGQIMVIGFDGDTAAVGAIKDGLMQGSIAQQPYFMGELGVELANKLLTGGKIIYDDRTTKELYIEVYLIDEKGEVR